MFPYGVKREAKNALCIPQISVGLLLLLLWIFRKGNSTDSSTLIGWSANKTIEFFSLGGLSGFTPMSGGFAASTSAGSPFGGGVMVGTLGVSSA